MLHVKKIVCNHLEENTYIVWDETKSCVIIDCGALFEEEKNTILEHIRQENLSVAHVLGTHGHIDHHFGMNFIHKEFGMLPLISEKDRALISHLPEQAQQLLHMQLENDYPMPEQFLKLDEEISFGNHSFKIIETPGHTPGGVTFYCEEAKVAFTGDTLFKGSVGRTDFPGGSMFQLINSLRELCQLPDDTTIYPGHGDKTTIGYELAHNPYLDR